MANGSDKKGQATQDRILERREAMRRRTRQALDRFRQDATTDWEDEHERPTSPEIHVHVAPAPVSRTSIFDSLRPKRRTQHGASDAPSDAPRKSHLARNVTMFVTAIVLGIIAAIQQSGILNKIGK